MHRHNASGQDMMKFRCYGVEKDPDTVKLGKMNLLLNNVRGAKIRSELAKIDDDVVSKDEKSAIFQQFDIANLVGVIK